MKQIEQWFRLNLSEDDQMKINYDSDLINIKRLIDDQDTNELLNITEYILAIVVRGEKQEEMIDQIFKLSENAQEDLQ